MIFDDLASTVGGLAAHLYREGEYDVLCFLLIVFGASSCAIEDRP